MNVQYISYGDSSIVLRVDGKHRPFQNEDPEFIQKLQDTADRVNNGDEQAEQELEELIDPIKRYRLEGMVEQDDRGNVYFGSTNVPMPDELGELIVQWHKEGKDVDPLVNFWQLCLLNPNAQARDDFFSYVRDYNIVITDNGYVILYKALNKRDEGKLSEFSDFISEKYLERKRANDFIENYNVYGVYNDKKLEDWEEGKPRVAPEEFIVEHISRDKIIKPGHRKVYWGNLNDLYHTIASLDKDKQTVYEPSFKGDYGQEVKIGEPAEMPREKCDPDIDAACSYGLHVGSYDYVRSFGYNMDRVLAVLVNPKDIVALPKHNNSKIRTCRYYPYAPMIRDEEGEWEEIESGYFEEEFADIEEEEIKNRLREMYSSKANEHEFTEEEEEEEAILNARLVDIED